MNKAIGRQAKDIVYKVYKYFQGRKLDRSSYEHINDINLAKTVAAATGISPTTVKKIVKEGKSMEGQSSSTTPVTFKAPKRNLCPKKKIEIDGFTEGVIRRKVSQWYTVKKCIPSIKALNAELKEENVLQCSHEYLRQTLHRLGFKFLSTQSKRKLLIERHDVMRLRWQYIQNIKKYRNEDRPIFFLGETYVNQNYVAPNSSQSAEVSEKEYLKKKGRGSRLVIVHAGSRNGFVNNALLILKSDSTTGDYHGGMNSTNFQKWVEEKLLPNIPQNSIVVMDTAAHHSTQIDKKPTMAYIKMKMQEWLSRRGLNHDSSLRKCDLMKIISEQNIEKQYKIDEILKEKGHTVLRLPPCHLDLNPIEVVWAEVIGELALTSIDSDLDQKKIDLESIITQYSPERWRNCDEYVIKNENEYYELDRTFDDNFDSLVVSIKEGEDDDDDDEDDEDDDEEMEESDMEVEYILS